MRIFNLGSINIDHVYRVDHFVEPGETLSCGSVASFAGGKGFNQTIALARAGAAVTHIGAVGADGRGLVETLTREGVDASAVSVDVNRPTGHAIIQVDPDGQNNIIIAGGANAALTAQWVAKALERAVPGDMLLAQNETTAVAEALRLAHGKGMRTALNPAPMNGRVMTLPLELVDILIVNEIEGAELSRLRGVANTETPESVLDELHRKFPNAQVIMTLGKDGVLAVEPSGRLHKAAAHRVDALDTTAAGDTFTGFYLAALSRGETVDDALRQASAASAIGVTRRGASPSIPRLDEVRKWLLGRSR
jgi:ribokinase